MEAALRYDNDEDELVFASGRRVYVHDGTIGISPDLTKICYGEDGHISWPKGNGNLTVDDMRELCDAMIDRWQRFKSTL